MSHSMQHTVPVIDLFAGPGGLAEGFSAFRTGKGRAFSVRLSVEKDPYAHRTLELRSFFRQFPPGQVPHEYYAYLRNEISRTELFAAFPQEAHAAEQEVWCVELGSKQLSVEEIDDRIKAALGDNNEWVLIGGPPCQAYSTVGRSRNKGIEGYSPEQDHRHFLYREYLRIISRHWPSVFVMENVKGLLSAQVNGNRIFERILMDLHDPGEALKGERQAATACHKYRIFSLAKPVSFPAGSLPPQSAPTDFLLMSEEYGIPQARHRVILLGVREDCEVLVPEPLVRREEPASAASVLHDLPKLRSGLSREDDTFENWEERVWDLKEDRRLYNAICLKHGKVMQEQIDLALAGLWETSEYERGSEFVPYKGIQQDSWYYDHELKGVCNHTTKSHMTADLHRYLFAACFAEINKRSPTLPEFPEKLWPDHKNAYKAKRSGNFSDRFRVQLADRPATTIMSHISKDGHYYIHYDAAQCRSLTVREAARLQTFPDNYFFEGPRTHQYTQVGNAVPPRLAAQIAQVVYKVLCNR